MFQTFNYICITNLSRRSGGLKQIEIFGHVLKYYLTLSFYRCDPLRTLFVKVGNLGGYFFNRGCKGLYQSKTNSVLLGTKINLLETAKQNKILQCLSLTTGAAKQAMLNENAIIEKSIEVNKKVVADGSVLLGILEVGLMLLQHNGRTIQ